MGFESAHAARRRLAMLAMSNDRLQEALAPSAFPGFEPTQTISTLVRAAEARPVHDVAGHLDQLANEIVSTPGAGGALLVAFAAQARALTLVVEASLRTQPATGLPSEVMAAVHAALRMPSSMNGLELAWRP